MAAATVTQDLREFCNLPGIEVVYLTFSDGNTYQSRKFSVILGATFCLNTDSDADTNVTFSGKTATLNSVGASSATGTLILFGRK